jgi:hypothetical protein
VKLAAVEGVIDRRILVNYRLDPEAVSRVVPAPFVPKTIGGFAIGGICLIRLVHERPRGLPDWLGTASENAAHRIAVEWESGDVLREGVFVPRRDTSSRMNTLLGGRLFPGVYHPARFTTEEADGRYMIDMRSNDGTTWAHLNGRLARSLPKTSVFGSIEDASEFFRRDALGYSVSTDTNQFDGIELRTETWSVEPLDVSRVESSMFDDAGLFPEGTAEFDCALLMKDIAHEWVSRGRVCCEARA